MTPQEHFVKSCMESHNFKDFPKNPFLGDICKKDNEFYCWFGMWSPLKEQLQTVYEIDKEPWWVSKDHPISFGLGKDKK